MSMDKNVLLFLEHIVTHSFDEIFITDSEGSVLYVSPSSQELYGIEPGQIINRNVSELEKNGILTPSVTSRVLKNLKSEFLVQQTMTDRKAIVAAHPIFDEFNNLAGTISFSRDITELEHLKRRNEEIAKTILLYKQEIKELRDKNSEMLFSQNEKMSKVFDIVSKVADLDVTVLLEGESGVGKNRLAQTIHGVSQRKHSPFVEVNCGAIPESLIESELFGYEEGAFTGASKRGKKGYFEAAEGGTIFLDEITELPINLQVKLLSVLQNQAITRVGGYTKIPLRCRIICATNQSIEQMVKEQMFRKDLYYRINIIKITIPPLRERQEEINFLISQIRDEFNVKYSMNKKFSENLMIWLNKQEWPGNVRELRNYIEKTMITSNSDFIDLNTESLNEQNSVLDWDSLTYADYMENIEKEFIMKMYQKYPSSIKLSEKLGISQSTANRKINKYTKQNL